MHPFPSLSLFFLCFFFPIDLRLLCVCVVIDTTCDIYVIDFLGWQAGYHPYRDLGQWCSFYTLAVGMFTALDVIS